MDPGTELPLWIVTPEPLVVLHCGFSSSFGVWRVSDGRLIAVLVAVVVLVAVHSLFSWFEATENRTTT